MVENKHRISRTILGAGIFQSDRSFSGLRGMLFSPKRVSKSCCEMMPSWMAVRQSTRKSSALKTSRQLFARWLNSPGVQNFPSVCAASAATGFQGASKLGR